MFKVGDKVESLTDVKHVRTKGKIYTIVDVDSDFIGTYYIYISDNNKRVFITKPSEVFKKVKDITTEIDVWLTVENDTSLSDLCRSTVVSWSEEEAQTWVESKDDVILKARLIVEIPEKKIEINEKLAENVLNNLLNNHRDIEAAMKELGFNND